MANYASLKTAIQNVVKTNGNNEITGALLQQSLLAMINSLGIGYQFAGVATPSTDPGTPDQNVFYIAGPGTYANFSNVTVDDGYIGVFAYNGSWTNVMVVVGKNYDAAIAALQLAFNVFKSEDDVKTDLIFDVQIGYDDLTLTDANGYIVRKSTGKVESGSTSQGILYFPVVAGKSYRIKLNALYCQSTYSTVSFSQSVPAANVETTLIWGAPSTGNQTENIDYNATQNGYVFVLYNAVAQKTRITGQRKTTTYVPKFFTAADIDDQLLSTSENPVQNKVITEKLAEYQAELYEAVEISTPMSLTDANGFIVRKSNNKVESGSTNQGIMYFPVVAGHNYKINLNNLYCVNAYSTVSFSTVAPALDGTTTLIFGIDTTGEYTQTINYTPAQNGYVFVLYNAATQKTRITASEETIEYRQKYADIKGWTDYKWTVIGDSLTEHNQRALKNYHDFVNEWTGIVVQNLGVGGTGYANPGSGSNLFYNRIGQIASDTNVITIFGSFNDMDSGKDLGNVSDTGFDTICGCINETISALQNAFPLINLGVVTPTPWSSYHPTVAGNSNAENYVNALIEICKIRSVPCLDLFHCSNLRPWDAAFRSVAYRRDGTYTASTAGTPNAIQVTADLLEYIRTYGGLPNAQIGDWVLKDGAGVHPDENGHKLIAPRFKVFVETLLEL